MLRRSLTAGLALAGVLAVTGPAHAATTITPQQAAEYGAGWVGRQLDATGYVSGLGGPDYNTTALGVLALVAAGIGEEQAAAATSYLMSHVDAYVVDADSHDRPAALAALILVAHARGLDPAALVTRLLATQQTTGADKGLFGAQDATYDGAYRQGLALLALDAVGQTNADAVAWLTAEQCADGGWMGNRPDQAAACPAFDFTSFVGEDSNGTAVATQALAAVGATPAYDPRDFLADAQNADGGFGFVPGFGSDANSTALAIQALLALGEDLGDWAAPQGTPYSFLLSLQLPNPPATTAGAFAFQAGAGGKLTANAYATVQAVPALAGKTFPLAPATLADTLPLLPAAVTAPTATPTPTAVVTPAAPKPTAAPTRAVAAAPVPELPDTGPVGAKPWDATGQVVFGLGLVGYGLLALGGARLARRRG
ncbi:MAG TPA: hypothetical protein VFQ85_00090 [Mycobacteriales bacterium]|nr:hypothetical protein [Mycobacteriales bacterium]